MAKQTKIHDRVKTRLPNGMARKHMEPAPEDEFVPYGELGQLRFEVDMEALIDFRREHPEDGGYDEPLEVVHVAAEKSVDLSFPPEETAAVASATHQPIRGRANSNKWERAMAPARAYAG